MDLRHINYLNKKRYELAIKDLYFGLCIIITYQGLIFHAQVMTPGIIFNSEHLIVFGEHDEGKVRNDEQFKNDISSLMNSLGIVSTSIKNDEGTIDIENYLGHPELKGVIGVDKRKYLFDLVHLMPRDLNFDDPGALVRPELIEEYRLKECKKYINSPEVEEKMAKITGEIEEKSKQAKNNKDLLKMIEKPLEERETYYQELEKKVRESIKLNVSYKTEYLTPNVEQSEIETLEKIAKFLKEDQIISMLNSMSLDDDSLSLPAESDSLKECLHKYGISTRYFGIILETIENNDKFKKKLNWLKTLIKREVIVKSARLVFNQLIKNVPKSYVNGFIAYFLNVLLGHPNQIKALEYFDVVIGEDDKLILLRPDLQKVEKPSEKKVNNQVVVNIKNVKENKDDKKKKKKHKKKNKVEIDDELKTMFFDNLISNNVSKLINNVKENSIFVKPSEVSNINKLDLE